jgi:hypothetical protein
MLSPRLSNQRSCSIRDRAVVTRLARLRDSSRVSGSLRCPTSAAHFQDSWGCSLHSSLCSSALSAWRLSYFRLSAVTGAMPGLEAYIHTWLRSRHALQVGSSPLHLPLVSMHWLRERVRICSASTRTCRLRAW